MRPPLRDTSAQRFGVYMLVKDRKRLARLIEIKEVSKRDVAKAAGWKSHTYLLRLLSGEARTCEPGPAMQIAAFLEVDVYDLFMPKVSSGAASGRQPRAKEKVA